MHARRLDAALHTTTTSSSDPSNPQPPPSLFTPLSLPLSRQAAASRRRRRDGGDGPLLPPLSHSCSSLFTTLIPNHLKASPKTASHSSHSTVPSARSIMQRQAPLRALVRRRRRTGRVWGKPQSSFLALARHASCARRSRRPHRRARGSRRSYAAALVAHVVELSASRLLTTTAPETTLPSPLPKPKPKHSAPGAGGHLVLVLRRPAAAGRVRHGRRRHGQGASCPDRLASIWRRPDRSTGESSSSCSALHFFLTNAATTTLFYAPSHPTPTGPHVAL